MSRERNAAMSQTNGLPQSIAHSTLDAKIRLYQNQENPNLLGFADLFIDGAFVIRGIAIRSSKEDPANRFVSFPSRKGSGQASDKYFDVAHPITPEAHQRAKELILEKYEEAVHGNA